jgi:hypothetical protein
MKQRNVRIRRSMGTEAQFLHAVGHNSAKSKRLEALINGLLKSKENIPRHQRSLIPRIRSVRICRLKNQPTKDNQRFPRQPWLVSSLSKQRYKNDGRNTFLHCHEALQQFEYDQSRIYKELAESTVFDLERPRFENTETDPQKMITRNKITTCLPIHLLVKWHLRHERSSCIVEKVW